MTDSNDSTHAAASTDRTHAAKGRWYVLAAAVMWSTNGFFAKAPIFDDWPQDERGMLLAFWRALFAGGLLAPMIRRPRFRWALVPMTVCFTALNITFLQSVTLTTAANAIWLQNTAPFWVFLAAIWLTHERITKWDFAPVGFGVLGVAVILGFEAAAHPLGSAEMTGVLFGLASGATYAAVVLFLRSLRNENGPWLVAINHLVAAAVLAPYVLYVAQSISAAQLAVVAAFGFFQMGLPYILFSRGLRYIASHEGASIGLLEPVLVPIWVWLAWGEKPAWWTLLGGGLILVGLALRYFNVAKTVD